MRTTFLRSLGTSAAVFASDIKFAHSVFALPFALIAVIFSAYNFPDLKTLGLLLICMVSARTFAMGSNRWLDQDFDAKNIRTQNRSIPSGRLSPRRGLAFTIISGIVFVLACAFLNNFVLFCSLPMLLILGVYSLMKRITWLSHFYLGACLGLAPLAVCFALGSSVAPEIYFLAVAVMVWTAGFDCLYSVQDLEFDRQIGLHSVPQQFGPKMTFSISSLCFFLMVVLLSVVGWLGQHGISYFLGVATVALLLIYELWLVRDIWHSGRSSNMHAAFFTSNAGVSIIFLIFCIMDKIL